MNKLRHIAFVVPTLALTSLSAMYLPAGLGAAPSAIVWPTKPSAQDDAVYRSIRASVDNSLYKGQKASILAEESGGIFRSQPYDPKRLFKYAYASFKAMQDDVAYRRSGKFADVVNLVDAIPSKQSYELDRLHFLVKSEDSPGPALKAIGFALLKHNPGDNTVKYFVVEALEPGRFPAEKKLGIKYSKELIRSEPSNPKFIALLGFVYDLSFLVHHNKADAENMIKLYRRYLTVSPTDDNFRSPAMQRIKYAQDWLNKNP